MGSVNPNNRYYFTKMRHYMYDKKIRSTSANLRPDFEVRKLDWKTQDKSRHTPMQ